MKPSDFEIRVAKTKEEKEEAFGLRYKIFKQELGNNTDTDCDGEIETDVYDEFCDHLIVRDKIRNLVVGTYRLLLGSKVDSKIGFYSEKIFDIHKIKGLGKQILELGRSCVHRDYREGVVVNLLWKGIAEYIKDNHIDYLFGSVRLKTREPQEVSRIFSLIKERYYAPEEMRVYPLKECVFKDLDEDLKISDHKEIFLELPALVKGYLRLGLKICGPPAWNRQLESVVLFVLLDMEHASKSYKKHFLGIYSPSQKQ